MIMIKIKNMALGDWGNTKALFSIEIDEIWIGGFKIINTNGDYWVGVPSRKTKDGEYKDIVGMTKEKKEILTKVALAHYKNLQESKLNYK